MTNDNYRGISIKIPPMLKMLAIIPSLQINLAFRAMTLCPTIKSPAILKMLAIPFTTNQSEISGYDVVSAYQDPYDTKDVGYSLH